MSEERLEILRRLARGEIGPEEAERLLGDLDARPSGAQPEDPGRSWTDGAAQAFQDLGDSILRAVDDAVGAAQRIFEEHRPETESVAISAGAFPAGPGSRLKVQQAVRFSFGGGSKGGDIVIRRGEPGRVRILRGEAVEVHRSGGALILTWAKGNLELEIPPDLDGLEVRSLGGDLEIVDHPGRMSLETLGGELRVRAVRAPFRFRSLGGKIRVVDLDLREGTGSISSTGGDLQIELAPDASATIHASTFGGRIELPPGAGEEASGRPRRRAVCVAGEGTARIAADTLGGQIRITQRGAPEAS